MQQRTIMWGWGRSIRDDDGTSNNTSSTTPTATNASSSKLGGFGVPSPRSPVSLSAAITPKKMASFSSAKNINNNNTNNNNRGGNGIGQNEFSKHRRRSWGGKRSKNNNINSGNEILTAVTIMEKGPSLTESYSGIEVSLSHDKTIHNIPSTMSVKNTSTDLSSVPSSNYPVSMSLSTNLGLRSTTTTAGGRSTRGKGGGSISFVAQIGEFRKIYRAQFQSLNPIASSSSVANASGLPPSAQHYPISSSNQSIIDIDKSFRLKGNHRLPLFDNKLVRTNYDDALALLKGYEVKDEAQCVKDEIDLTELEISALTQDRKEIERLCVVQLANVQTTRTSTVEHRDDVAARVGGSDFSSNSNRTADDVSETEYDINRQLATSVASRSGKSLTALQVAQLQRKRGLNFTVSIENAKALEFFLSKCGGKATTTPTSTMNHTYSTPKKNSLVTTLRPSNEGKSSVEGSSVGSGAACVVQQATLLSSASSKETSFFIATDTGNSLFYGRLPASLFRRLKQTFSTATGSSSASIASVGIQSVLGLGNNAESNETHSLVRNLISLSTGPCGSYYAEFRSGECWWGLMADEDELDAICSEWDVYRIAFGPCTTLDGVGADATSETSSSSGHNSSTATIYRSTSWIVIARDGRAAWKNLPSRLHNKLSSRLANESTPIEVSLGYGGSYFIRFLDGSTDWQLPSRAAEVCQRLEKEGSQITSISLHPESPQDFIIRHR